MATNIEFYKDSLVNYLATATPFAVRDGKIEYCKGGECARCLFDPAHCVSEKVMWLKTEHIEQPKLTKMERAFCEVLQTGYIARDENGFLYWFPNGAEIKKGPSKWHCGFYSDIGCMKIGFEFITWEDEKPWAVVDLLKLEVE